MNETHEFAGALLEKGAAGYAGMAASLMLERQTEGMDETDSHDIWKQHII